MKSRILPAVLIGFALTLACLPTLPGAPTPDLNAALTQAAATLNPEPTAFSGTRFESEGVRFVIPAGLAGGASLRRVPGARGADLPPWEVSPDYREITLMNYALGPQFHEPVIRVYPAQDFYALSESAARAISDLPYVFANPGAIADLRSLPFLPVFPAAQVFHAQTRIMDFTSGRGLRYLTAFAQYYAPVNNHDMIYTFQGITSDGAYYVSVILPVHAPFLAANAESPAPADGVPFPDWNAPGFEQQYPGYLAQVTQRLNAAAEGVFSPTLTMLDALARSIEVTGP